MTPSSSSEIPPRTRDDGRGFHEMREVAFHRHYLEFAEGSCLACFGRTRVLCAASLDDRVPPFLIGSGQGWITAEYAMLPKSSLQRISRDRSRNGRAMEIQRLIGRALRSVVDLSLLGERTIYIDCDVIQADGGTRTAAISGAIIALYDALDFMKKNGLLFRWPLKGLVSAVSVGLVEGVVCLDLNYNEDSMADVDFNVVKTDNGRFVEIQGSAEHDTFSAEELKILLDVADKGIGEIYRIQTQTLNVQKT